MAAHHASPRPARNLDCAAQSRLDDYRCAPPTDVCKISIAGSTPAAASSFSPANGHFPVVRFGAQTPCATILADIVPTGAGRELRCLRLSQGVLCVRDRIRRAWRSFTRWPAIGHGPLIACGGRRCDECDRDVLELTRFCGHLSIGGLSPPEGSPHGKDTTAIHAGVPL